MAKHQAICVIKQSYFHQLSLMGRWLKYTNTWHLDFKTGIYRSTIITNEFPSPLNFVIPNIHCTSFIHGIVGWEYVDDGWRGGGETVVIYILHAHSTLLNRGVYLTHPVARPLSGTHFYGWVNQSPYDNIAAPGDSNPRPFSYESYALTNCAITARQYIYIYIYI